MTPTFSSFSGAITREADQEAGQSHRRETGSSEKGGLRPMLIPKPAGQKAGDQHGDAAREVEHAESGAAKG